MMLGVAWQRGGFWPRVSVMWEYEGRGFGNCGLEKRAGLPSGVSLCYSELCTAEESHANATPVFHHHKHFFFFTGILVRYTQAAGYSQN